MLRAGDLLYAVGSDDFEGLALLRRELVSELRESIALTVGTPYKNIGGRTRIPSMFTGEFGPPTPSL